MTNERLLNKPLTKMFLRCLLPFTDFPMREITLFACWGDGYWVLMLTSEY